MKKKQIKAVDMVRRIRDKHYELLKGKTTEERIAFYRQKARTANSQVVSVQQEQGTQGR